MSADPAVRLPGHRRAELADEAAKNGVEIPPVLHRQLLELAGRA
jgi:LDH2 family malate/lactate/ureidoglycolate dehydrogenase